MSTSSVESLTEQKMSSEWLTGHYAFLGLKGETWGTRPCDVEGTLYRIFARWRRRLNHSGNSSSSPKKYLEMPTIAGWTTYSCMVRSSQCSIGTDPVILLRVCENHVASLFLLFEVKLVGVQRNH